MIVHTGKVMEAAMALKTATTIPPHPRNVEFMSRKKIDNGGT